MQIPINIAVLTFAQYLKLPFDGGASTRETNGLDVYTIELMLLLLKEASSRMLDKQKMVMHSPMLCHRHNPHN